MFEAAARAPPPSDAAAAFLLLLPLGGDIFGVLQVLRR